MERTAPTAHSGHDELLIARLYGGDVDEVERARALDLVADCRECAELFADLGSIASAVAAMPAPIRPREFSLTPEDAARLRRRRPGWRTVFRSGLRRSLGSSLAALGLIGVLATGGLSLLSSATTNFAADTHSLDQQNLAGAPEAPLTSAEDGIGKAVPTAQPIAVTAPTEAPAASAASITNQANATRGPATAASATEAAPPPLPLSTGQIIAAASPQQAFSNGQSATTGAGSPVAAELAGPIGMDARLVWLVGFGLLFGVGLLILFLPLRPRHRGRGPGSRS